MVDFLLISKIILTLIFGGAVGYIELIMNRLKFDLVKIWGRHFFLKINQTCLKIFLSLVLLKIANSWGPGSLKAKCFICVICIFR